MMQIHSVLLHNQRSAVHHISVQAAFDDVPSADKLDTKEPPSVPVSAQSVGSTAILRTLIKYNEEPNVKRILVVFKPNAVLNPNPNPN